MGVMGQDQSESMRRMRAITLVWTGVIVLFGILPLSNFVGHSHWEYIKWVPTLDDLHSPHYLLDIGMDIVANTLLFVPFGYLFASSISGRTKKNFLLIGGAAAVLSCGIEFFQVYCHSRFPSVLDVIFNVLGSLIGIAMTNHPRWGSLGFPVGRATPIPRDHTPAP